jgi:predicted unusual protein kinase regulating ubiquinone biosynthesis (AarF/ABC1/UbiB family)
MCLLVRTRIDGQSGDCLAMESDARAVIAAENGSEYGYGRLASALFSKDGVSAAEDAAEVLGTLRGLAAKIGQMASYVDGMVPDEHRAAYAKALRVLRDAAPRSSTAEIRSVVEEDLGAPIDRLFAAWEDEPFASASIGQVHAARLADGRDVVVKVQHPGIDRAIESDLKNASMLEGAVRVVGPSALQTKAVFDVIRARIREELDYGLEAKRQTLFARLHEGDSKILIPRVIDDRCGRRVLTTDRARGVTLEDAAREDEPARRAYAETLWRFVFKGNLVGGMFNADPHPGNYVFQGDGRISFLDFGCVQMIADDSRRVARAVHVAARARDERGFEAAMRELLGLKGGSYEAFALSFTRRMFEPLFVSSWRMTPAYVTEIVRGVKDAKMNIVTRGAKFVAPPPSMVFMNRLQFGFYSVLADLDVEVDYAEVERVFLREAGLL